MLGPGSSFHEEEVYTREATTIAGPSKSQLLE